MAYDKDLIAGKLRRWEKYLDRFRLPTWEEIPNLGLYMEQIISLLTQYLDYLPPELKDERLITAAAVNNYVRTKIMPRPDKKKYHRIHIAYLIIICTLKQGLNISMVKNIIPIGISEDEVKSIYESYIQRHKLSVQYFVSQVKLASAYILEHETATELAVSTTEELVSSVGIISGFSRLLCEKLLLLNGATLETGGSIEIDQ